MRLVPLSKWGRVNEDYAILNERLCSDKLVVTGVVYDIDNSCLSGARFTSPGKVTVVQSESAGLEVSTSDADSSDSSGTDLVFR